MDDSRYESWIDDVCKHFDSFADSPFYSNNPALELYRKSDFSPVRIIAEQDDRNNTLTTYCYNQLLYTLEHEGCTYRQIVHKRSVGRDPTVFWSLVTPLWASLHEARRELMVIRAREIKQLEERKSSGAPVPHSGYINEYLGAEVVSETDGNIQSASSFVHCDGRFVELLAETFNTVAIVNDIKAPIWAPILKTFSKIMAINTVVNRYWIAHLLCGAHSQYQSSEEHERALVSSLFGLPRPLIVDGVPVGPTLYRVMITQIDGLKKDLCFVNTAVMKAFTHGTGRDLKSGKVYDWLTQSVCPDGSAIMMRGRVLEINKALMEKYPALIKVNNLIKDIEIKYPFIARNRNNAEVVPLIAIMPSICVAPTLGYSVCDIELYNGDVATVQVSAHVIESFQFC